MIDSSNENNNPESQPLSDGVVADKNTEIGLPANRVIRKRLAARTIGVHLSALPPELQAFKESTDNAYLTKYDLPDEVHLTVFGGDKKVFSRDEVWEIADEAGAKQEWDILPDTLSGKATALFSTTGQGVYANYGRPTMDFSGFFYDHVGASGHQATGSIAYQGANNVLLGPLFIAMDTASAIGFTSLGHITRGAQLTDKTVLADVVSTGVYEGSTSWTSAKLGVLTGAKAIRFAAALPIPGAHLAAVPVGFLVGAATAIFVKHFTNKSKDKAIDVAHQSVMNAKAFRAGRDGEIIPA